MERYSLRDARDHLPQLIADAQHGKTVLILDEHDQAVQLVPVAVAAKPRKVGSARGQIKMAADFDAPLPLLPRRCVASSQLQLKCGGKLKESFAVAR